MDNASTLRELLRDANTAAADADADTAADPAAVEDPDPGLGHLVQGMMTLRTLLSTVAREDEDEPTAAVVEDTTANSPSLVRTPSLVGEADEGHPPIVDVDASTPTTVEDGDSGRTVVDADAGGSVGPSQTPPATADSSISPSPRRRRPRTFFTGQWLDVQDTVNQWLECTVLDVANNRVLAVVGMRIPGRQRRHGGGVQWAHPRWMTSWLSCAKLDDQIVTKAHAVDAIRPIQVGRAKAHTD